MDFTQAYPNSSKVYVEGKNGIRVPVREIALSGGEPPLQVYDTSGPHNVDVNVGLPRLRAEWVVGRGDVAPSGNPVLASPMIPDALINTPLRAVGGNVRGVVSMKVFPLVRQTGRPHRADTGDDARPLFAHLKLRSAPADAD